jgi:hypothetical protein
MLSGFTGRVGRLNSEGIGNTRNLITMEGDKERETAR